jgi:hypothetical protein
VHGETASDAHLTLRLVRMEGADCRRPTKSS